MHCWDWQRASWVSPLRKSLIPSGCRESGSFCCCYVFFNLSLALDELCACAGMGVEMAGLLERASSLPPCETALDSLLIARWGRIIIFSSVHAPSHISIICMSNYAYAWDGKWRIIHKNWLEDPILHYCACTPNQFRLNPSVHFFHNRIYLGIYLNRNCLSLLVTRRDTHLTV